MRLPSWTFWLAFGLVLLSVFYAAVFTGRDLFSGDNIAVFHAEDRPYMQSFSGQWFPRMIGAAGGARLALPQSILDLILPPRIFNIGMYIVDTVLLFLAAVYFLRGRGIRGAALFIPAMAFTFTGYGFTLIAAGHRGMFHVRPWAVLVFALLDRGISRKSILYFALAGICAGYTIMSASDVGMLFLVVAATYGMYRLVISTPRQSKGPYFGKLLAGVLIAALCFSLTSAGFISSWLKTGYQRRQIQIGENKTADEKWEFATNWSMPPEEILEFVAPCIYGYETANREIPYWGRLGRTLNWMQTRKGFRNFRQHTVYLGVFSLIFAAYAMAAAFRRKEKRRSTSSVQCSDRTPELAVAESSSPESTNPQIDKSTSLPRSEVFFWASVFFAALLLSLGRFFPLPFRVFHSIPGLSIMRCPVKFIHLCEFSLVFLFAAGLTVLLSDLGKYRSMVKSAVEHRGKKKRSGERAHLPKLLPRFGVVTAALGLLMFAGAGVVLARASALEVYWADIGFGNHTGTFMANMTGALCRGGFLFLLASAVFFSPAVLGRSRHLIPAAVLFITAVVGIDHVTMARGFVNVRDVSVYSAPNPVADVIETSDQLGRTAFYLSMRNKVHPVYGNFCQRDIDFLYPRDILLAFIGDEYKQFFDSMQKNVLRLWQITNTRFIVGPAKMLQSLTQHPAFQVRSRFNIDNRGRILPAFDAQSQNVLLEFQGALPRAVVYHAWEKIDRDAAFSRLSSKEWDPWKSVLVSSDVPLAAAAESRATSPATVHKHSNTRVEISANLHQPGILLLNDKHDPDWQVTVNGKRAELLVCNFIARGVYLDEGAHRVVFTYRPYMGLFLLCIIPLAVVAIWGGVILARRRQSGSDDGGKDH